MPQVGLFAALYFLVFFFDGSTRGTQKVKRERVGDGEFHAPNSSCFVLAVSIAFFFCVEK